LLEGVLKMHLQAASSPSKGIRAAQVLLALICVVGAFVVAVRLVKQGPPAPKATVAVEEAQQEAPKTAALITSAAGHANASSAQGAGSGTAEGETEGDSSSGTAPEEEDSTSSLNEQGPWAFAIVALVIGAFLAAGQSLSFGSGQPDPAAAGAQPAAGEPAAAPPAVPAGGGAPPPGGGGGGAVPPGQPPAPGR
jgi:hypothetical protein